jgi:hypothetical protein
MVVIIPTYHGYGYLRNVRHKEGKYVIIYLDRNISQNLIFLKYVDLCHSP